MSDVNNATPQEEFGIGEGTTSRNAVSMSGGINKAVLTRVAKEEIGKTTKYTVLNFKFVDLEGIKSFTHTEFIPKGTANTKQTEAENYQSKKEGFNSRMKHIFEAYAVFPKEGLGFGAKTWESFFELVAQAFNTANGGKPVFQVEKDGKLLNIPVFIKNTYSNKGDLQFPLRPNFIERITPETANGPKTLVIDKRYDNIIQPNKADPSQANQSQILGAGGGMTSNPPSDGYGF